MHRRLMPALAFSVLFHALPFASDLVGQPETRKQRPPLLEARLRLQPAPAPAPEQPPLILPEPPKPAKTRPSPRPRKPEREAPSKQPSKSDWTAEVRKQLKELDKQGMFYPEEAIARGLEGEAVVLLILDETGNAVAARIEQGSGHRILDDAALRAARSLKSLPAAAPREIQLPVRFRLR